MGRKIRRVVTGHDENGVATVIMDGDADCILQRPNRPGVTLTNLWQNTKTPAAMERHDDPVTGPLILHPPKNGSIFALSSLIRKTPTSWPSLMAKRHFQKWALVRILLKVRAILLCTALTVWIMRWF